MAAQQLARLRRRSLKRDQETFGATGNQSFRLLSGQDIDSLHIEGRHPRSIHGQHRSASAEVELEAITVIV